MDVMINFMCQFDWTIECPDNWSTLFWVFLLSVFLDEINISSRIKPITFRNVGGPLPIS